MIETSSPGVIRWPRSDCFLDGSLAPGRRRTPGSGRLILHHYVADEGNRAIDGRPLVALAIGAEFGQLLAHQADLLFFRIDGDRNRLGAGGRHRFQSAGAGAGDAVDEVGTGPELALDRRPR